MPKKNVADLSFSFADDGELELTGFDEDDVFEEIEEEEVEEEEVEEEEVEEIEELNVTSRVDSMEKTIQALPQMISDAISSALSKSSIKQEVEEEIPDELDNKQIVNILAKRMEKEIDKRVGSIMQENEPALRQARLTADFQNTAAKYGQKFVDKMVPIAKIIQKSNYLMSCEDAYDIVKDLPVGKVSTKQVKKSAVKVDADSKDAIGEVLARPKFNLKDVKERSDTDVFQQAFNSAMLSSVKGRKSA